MAERACATCEHYHAHRSGEGGECHRFPPTPMTYNHVHHGRQIEYLHPVVYHGFRCGEWSKKREDD